MPPHDSPFESEWYYDIRIELIQAGLLSRETNTRIVRSYLKDELKKEYPGHFAALEAAQELAQPGRQGSGKRGVGHDVHMAKGKRQKGQNGTSIGPAVSASASGGSTHTGGSGQWARQLEAW